AWTRTTTARRTARSSTSGTATAARTRSGPSTPTAPSPATCRACAWTHTGTGRGTGPSWTCGRAMVGRTRSGVWSELRRADPLILSAAHAEQDERISHHGGHPPGRAVAAVPRGRRRARGRVAADGV